MKQITKWKSENGREFDNSEQAQKADELFAKQNEVSKLLPQAVDIRCEFANGGGYVQHTQEDVNKFMAGIRELIANEFGETSDIVKGFDKNPIGMVGRFLDDSGSDTYRLWSRLYNIDPRLREWGQRFYAQNIPTDPKPWPHIERKVMKYFGP